MADEIIYGVHASLEVLENNQTINKVYLSASLAKNRAQQIRQMADKLKVVVQDVDSKRLDELTDHGNHQGIAVSIAAYEYVPVDDILTKINGHDPFLVILDEIEDPHNLGSILRTADAAGVDGIIIPKRRAVQLTQIVAKVSTGAIEHVPVARVTNINNTIDELKQRGFWIFGTDMQGQDYTQWDARGSIAIVIGNEGKGISAQTKKKVDQMLTIPMVGHVQSLNASVAAALLIYQAFNSRRLKK
ncbi:23S rRNA (guanosine(2251)-2'-O)-methyltransferase RlmB [Oenococcus sicerae]|uniref:23S rRNA (guanosine(2251)-2'-O)-methyltransferase RlmB n=1 Tax=Oenococcus sicerae TaxID=2203724 RepID=UPI0039EA1183